jgi:transcriptional repressor NrdR
MRRLRHLDQVAFVRFASVYREFKDVHDFVDELKPMLRATTNGFNDNKKTE